MSKVKCIACNGSGSAATALRYADCSSCCGDGEVDTLDYARWFGDLIGGDTMRTPTDACPLDPVVEPSFVAAMNHWLDSLPDSPQGATLAGRMSKLRDRLT